MKKLIILAVLLAGCTSPTEWIEKHEKPIRCIRGNKSEYTESHVWTLIDANGDVYLTDFIPNNFPDTIKVMK